MGQKAEAKMDTLLNTVAGVVVQATPLALLIEKEVALCMAEGGAVVPVGTTLLRSLVELGVNMQTVVGVLLERQKLPPQQQHQEILAVVTEEEAAGVATLVLQGQAGQVEPQEVVAVRVEVPQVGMAVQVVKAQEAR